MIQLTDREFEELVTYIKKNYGINLIKKRLLIEARMYSVLSKKGITNFTDYINLIKRDPAELNTMLNKLTTNHTYFMREPRHFEFLKDVILPEQKRNNKIKSLKIWSAGCSTGEEAYTAIMVMKDFFALDKTWDYRILATDISTNVLQRAQIGIYAPESLKNIPSSWKKRYFKKTDNNEYAISDEIKKEVIFRQLNLMEPFPFTKKFDLIFCRNVMIYFDQQTKNKLICKFYDILKKGGYLFIGHSETVQRDTVDFDYIEPSIYRKG